MRCRTSTKILAIPAREMRAARGRRGLTVSQLARLAGVSRTTLRMLYSRAGR